MFFVYIIAPDTEFPCKVGVAENANKRLAALQVSNWEELHVFEAYEMPNRGAAYRLERVVHRRLSGHCIRGEWFNLMVSDIKKEINSILEERYSQDPLIYKDKRKRRILQHVV
jgi:hypothetical protein